MDSQSENSNGESQSFSNEIKLEPLEDHDTPEPTDINMEDVKIEVEEHPVAPKIGVDVPVFIPCTRQILPKINMFSIVEYFVGNPSFIDVDYKKLKTDIDINAEDTIGFVQLHILDEKVTLQGTVAFDTRTTHVCIVKYDNITHTVSYTNCECQQPACQHILAFLMWLHRRSEEQLDNNMSFYLEPLIQQTRILRATDLRHDSDTDSLSEDLDLPERSSGQVQGNLVQAFIEKCKELNMVNSPLYRYLTGTKNEALELSVYRLFETWVEDNAGGDAAHFLHYCTNRMLALDTVLTELVTCSDSYTRRELQYARMDAGAVAACAGVAGAADVDELIDTILDPDVRDYDTEDESIENLKQTLEEQLRIKINKCGIILSNEYPILYASPYGLTDTHVVDIVYLKHGEPITDYMEDKELKPHIKFKLQFNMLLSKKEMSYLFIGCEQAPGTSKSSKKQDKIIVNEFRFNEHYLGTALFKAVNFWEKHVFSTMDAKTFE